MGEAGETTTSGQPTSPTKRAASVATDSGLARAAAGMVAVASVVVGIWLGNRDRDRVVSTTGAEAGFGWEWCALTLLIGFSVALVLWFLGMVLRNQESRLAAPDLRSDRPRSRS